MELNKDIKQAAIVLLITTILVIAAQQISKLGKSQQPPNATSTPAIIEVPYTAVTCPADTDSYKQTKLNKNVVVLFDKQSAVGKNGLQTYDVAVTKSKSTSQIACGYLFYRIDNGGKPISEQYENLFMAPQNSSQFGGHIVPQSYNSITDSSINGKTEILMPLDNISYDGTGRQNFQNVNWVALLNVSNEVDFTIALNTLNPAGHIDSIEFAYKCWNPMTGKETQDCNLNSTLIK